MKADSAKFQLMTKAREIKMEKTISRSLHRILKETKFESIFLLVPQSQFSLKPPIRQFNTTVKS
jgi:hypothetical protein